MYLWEKEGLLALKRIADDMNYSIIMYSLLRDNIWKNVSRNIVENHFKNHLHKEWDIIRFLFLGDAIRVIESNLHEGEVKSLEAMGVLLYDEQQKIRLNNMRLIPFEDLLIFCDNLLPDISVKNDHVWFGDDSIYMSRVLMGIKNKKILDIGTGSGVLSLVMARNGNNVVSVDINIRAVRLAQWNSAINKMEDKIQVVHSDLFSNVYEKFDLIVSNPPFLPASLVEDGYFFASGGEDGCNIIRKILKSAGTYLNEKGQVYILGGGFGTDKDIFLVEEMAEYFEMQKYDVDFYIINKNKAEVELQRLKTELGILNAKDIVEYKNSEQYYYAFLIRLLYKCKGRVRIIDCHLDKREWLRINR